MGISSEQVNQLPRELTGKNYLEYRGDSVIYVCFQKEDIVIMLKEIDNLRERQLDMFKYVEMKPKFQSLIVYLIENKLQLYQIFQSPNPNIYTPMIEYDSSLLKLFGSLAVKSGRNEDISLLLQPREKPLSPKYLGEAKVECPDTVRVGIEFSYSVTIPVDETFQETVLPPFDNTNVDVYMGPSLSTSTNISIVNGKENKTYSRTYKYIIKGKTAKPIKILPYTIKSWSNGDYYSVPERTIVCTKDYNPKNKPKNTNSSERLSGNSTDTIFVYTTVDRKYLSIDDSVLVTTRLYTTSGCSPTSLSPIQKMLPDFCFCQPIKQDSLSMTRDSLNGVEYRSCMIDSYWIIPKS